MSRALRDLRKQKRLCRAPLLSDGAGVCPSLGWMMQHALDDRHDWLRERATRIAVDGREDGEKISYSNTAMDVRHFCAG